jgi:hypothetical protein
MKILISFFRFGGLLTLLLITTTTSLKAQDSPAKNGTYLEVYVLRHDFSNGFISANYERFWGKKKNNTVRVGLYPDFESTLSIPVSYHRFTNPHGAHHFEYGVGLVYRMEWFEGNFYQDIPAILFPFMYRYQRDRGFYFRAGVNLWVSFPVLPAPSLSVGYRF